MLSRFSLQVSVVALVLAPQVACSQRVPSGGEAAITEALIKRHIDVIADDSMLGRNTPSRGLDMTAAYIAAQFKRIGLKPGGDSGTFIQRYPLSKAGGSRPQPSTLGYDPTSAPNAVGILMGTDPALRDEYIVLRGALRMRGLVVAVAVLLFAGSLWLFGRLGAEFIPQLDEGALSIQMIRGNSVGLEASVDLQKQSERLLRAKFPEISHLFARIGTAEIATDPMGPNVADTYIFFHPRETWRTIDGRPAMKAELAELMRRELVSAIPGQTYLFTQPLQLRFNEIMAGARADLSLKIHGESFDEMERLALEALGILRGVRGGGDVEFEALGRVPMLEITPKRDVLQRLNLHADVINTVVAAALGGEEAGTLIEGGRRFDVVVRLPESRRLDLAALRELPVMTAEVNVPLSRIAEVNAADRVGTINREHAQRRIAILINVRGRDTEGFVNEASEQLRARMTLPPGYYFEFGGQFENLQTARARLAIVVPAALALIFVLIYASFGSARQAMLIFLCVPLAAIGGVVSLWLRGMPFTISAAVGFIALSGVAVLNGIMLISFINTLRAQGRPVREAVVEGALTRLRPLLMTALVASLGFVPMALSTGAGAEVQRPLATVVIGGIITSTFLTLIVLPVLYAWIEKSTSTKRRSNQPHSVLENSPTR
jgi:cobalt-zinc-cadmium resistance protein CzcA